MNIILQGVLSVSLLTSSLGDGPATELRYSGTLTQMGRDSSDAPVKRFTVYCLVVNRDAGRRNLTFLVDENGGGGWPWPERFGVIELDQSNKPTNRKRVRLLHNHDNNLNPITIRQPIFEFADKLKTGAKWNAGKNAFEVLRSRKIKDHDCWVVEVSTNFGRTQTLSIDKQSHLIVSAEQRVFMGQGDRFSLKFKLESTKKLDARGLSRLQKPVATLAKLQRDLNRAENQQRKPDLTDKQLETAAAVLQQLVAETEQTPFARYASVIRRDVKSQQQRETDVGGLAKKFVGARAPKLMLETLGGKIISPKDNEGKIVVLHFWEYRGKPLEEPYGQVGYLDFLNNKNRKRKLDVNIYGVAVDKRFAAPATRSAALRSVRELQKFFNLGYPITLDDGRLIGQFGDPRRIDAKLPLWVVIAADGKIAHYSTGFYNIKPDEGLKQLEAVIVRLVKKQRNGGK